MSSLPEINTTNVGGFGFNVQPNPKGGVTVSNGKLRHNSGLRLNGALLGLKVILEDFWVFLLKSVSFINLNIL